MSSNKEIIVDLVVQSLLKEYHDLKAFTILMERRGDTSTQEADFRYLAAFESVLEYYNGEDWKETFNVL